MFNKNENSLKFSVFVVGYTTIVAQIILLRNFLTVFNGNELIVGIIISNWMLITAFGAWISRFFKPKEPVNSFLFTIHILLGILPLLISFAVIYFRNLYILPGKAFSLVDIYLGSIILLLPFCFISGYLFTVFSNSFSSLHKSNQIYRVYGIEAIGAILGGLSFNFVFVFMFDSFFTLKLLLLLNFGMALFFYFITSKNKLPWAKGLSVFILAGVITYLDLGTLAQEELFKNQKLLEQKETPHGSLTVTETNGQLNFYENGIHLFSSDNVISNEENVHYAMLQHTNPENILLISGGVSGCIEEVQKYYVSSIDYVEIDPVLIKLSDKYLSKVKNSKLNIINQDARLFLKKIKKKYDVVLINLPDPYNILINRYYTVEFFEEIKEKLSNSGVLSISLTGSANYMNKESVQLHGAIYSTLKLVFNNVIVIPGQQDYFISSDAPLSAEIGWLAEQKSLNTIYVNQYYLDDLLIKERMHKITNEIKDETVINYDFQPSVYFIHLKLWMKKFNYPVYLIVGFILIILFVVVRMQIINYGIFVSGLTSTSMELLLIIAFQVIFGYVFFMLGIFISVFMIGLLAGSMYFYRLIKNNFKNFSFLYYIAGVIATIVPLILVKFNAGNVPDFILHATFIILILVIGIITGIQFSMGTNLRFTNIHKTASGAYGADSLGSAFGALIVATLLIPVFGLIKVCLVVGILNFITGLIILIRTRNN